VPLAPSEPLARLSDHLCAALRARFSEVGFTDAILSAAEAIGPMQPDRLRLPLVHWWLQRENRPAAHLAHLFVYRGALPETTVLAALGGALAGALRDAGVLAAVAEPPADRAGPHVRAAFHLLPFDGLWILCDEASAGAESVMGPAMTTLVLHGLLPSAMRGSLLDVGCGAGTLALVGSRRGARPSIGVDVNARAVAIARFNARLNALPAEFREGDGYEPVRGATFDLVVSQPPYVVRPPDHPATTFLHGGAWGDELALRFLREAPAALARDGRALLLFDSAVRAGEPLHARLRRALGGAAVDVAVLAGPAAAPDQQAIGYAALEAPDLDGAFDAAVRRYREHFAALGIAEFTHALVVMTRGSHDEPGGRYTITLPVRRLAGLSAARLDTFLASIELALADDETLARSRVRAAQGMRLLAERRRFAPDAPSAFTLRFDEGSIGKDLEVAERTCVLLGELDQADSVARAIASYAEALGASAAEARPEVIRFVREGLARGLLVAAP
jgi:SAM-dependent methyltransferase